MIKAINDNRTGYLFIFDRKANRKPITVKAAISILKRRKMAENAEKLHVQYASKKKDRIFLSLDYLPDYLTHYDYSVTVACFVPLVS